jgi:hypothetical protein
MRWDEFDRALCNECRKFGLPKFHAPTMSATDREIPHLLIKLDSEYRNAVDLTVAEFADTGKWKIQSHTERVLIWLRLNFAWQLLGLLALGMEGFDRTWSPFATVARLDDDCDDASVWNWFLIDAWHRCGLAHLTRTLECVNALRSQNN